MHLGTAIWAENTAFHIHFLINNNCVSTASTLSPDTSSTTMPQKRDIHTQKQVVVRQRITFSIHIAVYAEVGCYFMSRWIIAVTPPKEGGGK